MDTVNLNVINMSTLLDEADTSIEENDFQEAEQLVRQAELILISTKTKISEFSVKDLRQRIASTRTKITHRQLVGKPTIQPMADAALQTEQKKVSRLEDALVQLNEAEQDGINIVNQLAIDREKLQRVQTNLREVRGELEVSNTFLNRMSRWWRK